MIALEERFGPEKEMAMATRNKLNEISRRIENLERTSADFRKRMMTDFVRTITRRFESVEKSIEDISSRIEDYRIQSMAIQGGVDQTNIRINQVEQKIDEERDIEDALKELAGSEKIKVNKRLLKGLER